MSDIPRPGTTHRDPTAAALLLNCAGLAAAMVFALAGVARVWRSGHADIETNRALRFWTTASAVRTLAITAPLLASMTTGRQPNPGLLTAAACVQFGDSALGVMERNPRMTLAPAAIGVLHLHTARPARKARGNSRS